MDQSASPRHPWLHAEARPDAPAVVMDDGTRLTYGQLAERSNRAAHLFRARGLQPGEHIALFMDNEPALFEAAWAAQSSGLYFTPINRHLLPGEIEYILQDCEAKALIVSGPLGSVAKDLGPECHLRLAVGGATAGFQGWEEQLAAQPATPFPEPAEGREMLYSSGTTGRPKGVLKDLPLTPLGDRAAVPVVIAEGMAARGIGPGHVYLSPAPLYHSAPLAYSMSMHRLGATVVVMRRFDPALCLELIEQQGVTHAQFVPTMFVRLLQLPEDERARHDISSLQWAVHAAAPCPVDVKRRMLEWWGPIIDEYYGGTEDIGSTYITAAEWLAHPGSVGRPLSECHIVDEDGNELPIGSEGRVFFAGGRPFRYHNDPDKTASIMDERGWRTLGDVGRLDEDGYLYLTDRAAHMIIAGGVNIYPQETENVLILHPGVKDVAVIGVPDPDMGEAVKAVVEPMDPDSAGSELADELIRHCHEQLAAYKCPRSVDFVEELPRDPNGKLYKRLLRERYWQGHDNKII